MKIKDIINISDYPTQSITNLKGFQLRSKRDIITYEYQSQVRVRLYDVDIEGLQKLLNSHRTQAKKTMREISHDTNTKITTVEHWFRTDSSFSIPDSKVWPLLKKSIGITTDIFDKSITTFIQKDGNYDMANRIYHIDGIMPTITASGRYLITDGTQYRSIQPMEQLLLMGFTKRDYKVASSIVTDNQIRKQSGNSIAIPVLEAIFKELLGKK